MEKPPGSSVHGIFQARILERVLEKVAISWGFPGSSAGKESTCNVGDLDSILGLGRSPGEENSYPLQYSGLEKSEQKSVGLQRVGHD